ncbi:MRC1 domain-containing protein [Mycena kentingensis (nom. inval.)]|nr:MRC1 domain-containing protein [Mycena kentingensis (nom. inval.)]
MDTPSPPPRPKLRTYGKPKPADGEHHSAQVPPTHPTYDWKAELAKIDARYDDDDNHNSPPPPTKTPPAPSDDAIENPSPSPNGPSTSRRRVSRRVADSDEESAAEGSSAPQNKLTLALPDSDDDEQLPARLHAPSPTRPKAKRRASSRSQATKKRASEATKPKVKAPTKKELDETVRERHRLAASNKAGIQRVAKPAAVHTLSHFFNRVIERTSSIEDPIDSFSSSPHPPPAQLPGAEELLPPAPLPRIPATSRLSELPPLDSADDDDELPDVAEIVSQVNEDKMRQQRLEELKARKLKLLAEQRGAVSVLDDDEDELMLSEGRKKQLLASGIGLHGGSAGGGGKHAHGQLLRDVKMRAERDGAMIVQAKEGEWAKRGGNVMAAGDVGQNSAMMSETLKELATKGKANAEAREARMRLDDEEDDEDYDGSDPDWTGDGNEDITMVDEEGEEEEEEDGENAAPVRATTIRAQRIILDSDEEDNVDENAVQLPESGSVSPTEEEGDKENDKGLMFEGGDDKENRSVIRHPLGSLRRPALLGRQESLHGLEDGFTRSLSMSPGDAPIDDEEDNENESRKPLQKLRTADDSDSDPFTSQPSSLGLRRSSPVSTRPTTPDLTLRPSMEPAAFGAKLKSLTGFSQFSEAGDGQEMSFKGKTAGLQAGFSDLFDSGSKKSTNGGGLFDLRKTASALGLTQDVQLQPAFEVGERLKQKAEAIFAKEQEYIWEDANKNDEKPQLYVTEHGFLTQTRPANEDDVELYQPSSPVSPQSSLASTHPLSQSSTQPHSTEKQKENLALLRHPLSTLSISASAPLQLGSKSQSSPTISNPDGSPVPSPPRRLVRQRPARRSPSGSPTPRPSAPNAFDLIQDRGKTKAKERKPLPKSEYIQGEAEESDDDEMAIYRPRTSEGDEEDGEDQDQSLQTLVDDQEMDEKTAAADAVLEKYQEQQHEDDLALERLHQAATKGELRKKRRLGMGLDDSDDDDDEEDYRNKRMRRGLHEPRIERGNIKALEDNEATKPFFEVYSADLQAEPDDEFAYLREESQLPLGETQMADAEYEDEEEEAEARVIVKTSDLRRELQEVARNGIEEDEEDAMDVEDVSWMDADEEQETRVIGVKRREMRQPLNSGLDRERMSKWGKSEGGRSRNAGTGRASGRTAVTAQKPAARPTAPAPAPNKAGDGRRPVKHQPSILAGVADRSRRFE